MQEQNLRLIILNFFFWFQNRTLEQEKAIGDLENKVGHLERIRENQASKISGLKENLETTVDEITVKKESINNTIQALSSELRTTKVALEELTKRERQVCKDIVIFTIGSLSHEILIFLCLQNDANNAVKPQGLI